MEEVVTRFASLDDYVKGGVEIIEDDPRNYVFSNVFEVAERSSPYERTAVGKNFEYVIEVARAEGTSGWFVCGHDEFALCMDGTIEVHLIQPAQLPAHLTPEKDGAISLGDGMPEGEKMGRIVLGRGHMALLPARAAYRFSTEGRGVLLFQTVQGEVTIERWAEICQTTAN